MVSSQVGQRTVEGTAMPLDRGAGFVEPAPTVTSPLGVFGRAEHRLGSNRRTGVRRSQEPG